MLYRLLTDHEGFKSSAQSGYDQGILQPLHDQRPANANKRTNFFPRYSKTCVKRPLKNKPNKKLNDKW